MRLKQQLVKSALGPGSHEECKQPKIRRHRRRAATGDRRAARRQDVLQTLVDSPKVLSVEPIEFVFGDFGGHWTPSLRRAPPTVVRCGGWESDPARFPSK